MIEIIIYQLDKILEIMQKEAKCKKIYKIGRASCRERV